MVRVEARLDGSLQLRTGDDFVTLSVCEKGVKARGGEVKRPAKRYVSPPGKSQWMRHFSVKSTRKQPAAQGI
jgi:hypothetical protein